MDRSKLGRVIVVSVLCNILVTLRFYLCVVSLNLIKTPIPHLEVEAVLSQMNNKIKMMIKPSLPGNTDLVLTLNTEV